MACVALLSGNWQREDDISTLAEQRVMHAGVHL